MAIPLGTQRQDGPVAPWPGRQLAAREHERGVELGDAKVVLRLSDYRGLDSYLY